MIDAQQIADRYVAVWNETDAEARLQAIMRLWAPDARHYVDTREARGYAALEQRVASSHDTNVRQNRNCFHAVANARALRDVITFNWEMRPQDGERVLATGLEILIVDGEGRILVDYQFVLGRAPAAATA